jgi:hypothetical protein
VFRSCREASDATYLLSKSGRLIPPQKQYLHLTIDSKECKYQNQQTQPRLVLNRTGLSRAAPTLTRDEA